MNNNNQTRVTYVVLSMDSVQRIMEIVKAVLHAMTQWLEENITSGKLARNIALVARIENFPSFTWQPEGEPLRRPAAIPIMSPTPADTMPSAAPLAQIAPSSDTRIAAY